MLILITISIFASVALLSCATLYPMLSRRDAVRGRLEKLMTQAEEQPTLLVTQTRWQQFLANMGGKLQVRPTELRTYREMITAAGFRPQSVYIYLGCKLMLAVALPAFFLTLIALPHLKLNSSGSILLMIACAIFGFLLPTFWLQHRVSWRKTEIFHSLPDVLDLLTVCVEAGLSLNAALIKTSENFQQKNNPLITEINTVTQEIRVGKPREEALKGLAERTMVEDIKAFVAMLVQTEKFGTSLAKTLRTYSDSLRTKRRQLAEERAAKIGIKMLFPLTFFVFPAIMVVILTPAFFKIYGVLINMPKH
jgi:tight adherence protein C